MPRFEDDPKPRKPVRGVERPPTRDFVVFTDAFKEVRKAVEGLTEPVHHPVLGRLVELFRRTPPNPESEAKSPDPKL